jgi:tetratricopeptide (TPR) repeat protein
VKSKTTLIVFLLAVRTLCLDGSHAQAQHGGGEELFFRANSAYKEGRFEEALAHYNELVASGYRNGHIFYNLGNTHFRLKDLGRAILNYERARIFIPRDSDLGFNLRQARDQMEDVVSESQSFVHTAFFWLDDLSPREVFRIFAIINIAFWGVLLVRLFARPEWSYYFLLTLAVLWLLCGVSFGLKRYQVDRDDRAVILPTELDVLAGPDVGDTVLFKLHAGTLAHFERSEDGWALIRLQDKKRGWVRGDAIARIALTHEPTPALEPAIRVKNAGP